MNKQLNFKLRENNPYDNPDYKYELDIDTNNVKLMSQIINSTLLVESNDETGVTLYSNNKQALLGEKQRIEQLFLNTAFTMYRKRKGENGKDERTSTI